MKVRLIFCVYLLLLSFIITMFGCTTKGLNYEAAMQKYDTRQYDQALKIFDSIAKGKTKYANRARFFVGECYKYQFKWDEAATNFQAVADAEKTTFLASEARNRIAQIREGRRDVERLKITHENQPGTEQASDALLELGSVYDNKLNDFTKAMETYNQVITEFPGSPKAAQAQINIGYIYFYRFSDYVKGFEEFNKVNEKNYPGLKFRVTEVQDLLRNTNKTLGEIRDLQAFIKSCQKMKIPEGSSRITGYDIYGIKEDQAAQAFVAVAVKWRALKNDDKAIEAYRMLIYRLPLQLNSAAEARFGIAEVYYIKHDYFNALNAFEEYIKYHPTHYRRPEAIYDTAVSYESLRDYEKAYEFYKTYRDTYPTKEQYQAADLKVRQYEYDEDKDGFPYYKELEVGTSDTDASTHP